MTTRRLPVTALFLAGFCAAATPTAAQDPKAFACDFKAGAAFAYEKGAFASATAGPFGFEIADIDATAQSAKLGGGGRDARLRVVRAVNALHFIEVVGEGFLNVTTVYDMDDARRAHPAVHSRHFGILGQPVVAQYQGFCTSK